MTFFAFGVNHETAPVRIREQISLSDAGLRSVYRVMVKAECESVILSTCNRTEVYLHGSPDEVAVVRTAIEAAADSDWPAAHDFLFEDEEAVRHLLGVVTGLKSLVLGDGQIFSQVKDAYRVAVEEDAVGTAMHRLMHTAFRAAKEVISDTLLTSGNASVASAAVAVARDFFYRHDNAGLEGRHALILGAGQMGTLALEALEMSGAATLTVINRTMDRAERVASSSAAQVRAWEDRYEAVALADIVFVTTGASAPVLRRADLVRRDQPALFVDLSVPRNVDSSIGDMPGHEIIDLDDLNRMLVESERTRRDAIPAAEAICDEHVAEFVGWFLHHQSMQPAIRSIARTFDQIRRTEIERHAHRFSEIDADDLDRLTRSIMQKLLAVPIVHLKSTSPDNVDFVRGVDLLRSLFERSGCEDNSAEDETDEIIDRLLSEEIIDDTARSR